MSALALGIFGLTSPVPWDPEPATSPVGPMPRDPSRMRIGVADIVSRHPHIGPSVPVPPARIPGIRPSRRWRHPLNPRRWRSNPNNDFGGGGLGRQK